MTISDSTFPQVRREHHTENYKGRGLIVRRGVPVRLETTSTSLTCRLVPAHPENPVDLGYQFTVAEGEPANGWSLEAGDAHVELSIPGDAVVGLYVVDDGESRVGMTVLFNPFSRGDDVYMEGEEERAEYVLHDVGRIWVGSSSSPSGIPWLYSHFRTKVMLCAIHILDLMRVEDRRDPLKVCRHLSALLNSRDDRGVLVGRWDGRYSDGVHPSAWTGSAAILKQYWESLEPVRYGQCWVFAGVFTSVMRTLGIPSRTVTNFMSAHDTTKPYNRAVDKYYTSEGRFIPEKSRDSVWNFHVWNSLWCRRPDLESLGVAHGLDYDGWQIVDATPQEESSGLFQLGPAAVMAVKHGHSLEFDTDFVIGEVNADVIYHWQVEGSEEFKVRAKDSRRVGQKISTKAVGRDEREDVTLLYKFAEGSEEERASVRERSTGGVEGEGEAKGEVEFRVESPAVVRVGEAVRVSVVAQNRGEGSARVRVNVVPRLTDYTGRMVARLGGREEVFVVEGGSAGECCVTIAAGAYEEFLGRGVQTLKFDAGAIVEGTELTWASETVVRVNGDDLLTLSAPETISAGVETAVNAFVTNPTHARMTGVTLRAEGEGLAEMTVMEIGVVEVGGSAETEILVKGEPGERLLVVTLDSEQVRDVSRSVHIVVEGGEGAVESLWTGLHADDVDVVSRIEHRFG